MAIILFDDNLPKRKTRAEREQIVARVNTHFGFIENPPVFLDAAVPVIIRRPYLYCENCKCAISGGEYCSPCAQVKKNQAARKSKINKFFKQLFTNLKTFIAQ